MNMNDPKGLDASVTIITRNSKSEGRQHMMNRLLLTAVGMLSGMTAYESLKQLLFPSITIWQSHIITICFSVFIATLVTYLESVYKLAIFTARTSSCISLFVLFPFS